jgi:hypothetical protein
VGWHLGIDLAERFSATVLLRPDGTVAGESVADFGACDRRKGQPESRECRQLHLDLADRWAEELALETDHIRQDSLTVTIEDLSHHMINAKPAIRVQAVTIKAWGDEGRLPHLVLPGTWQKHHGYKKKPGQTTKGWAKERSAELGYRPAIDIAGGKSSVDLRDAFLLALYSQQKGLEP